MPTGILDLHEREGNVDYHFMIRKNGTIERGSPEAYRTNHCLSHGNPPMNHVSLGIIFEGNHDREEWTEAQYLAFLNLFLELNAKYDIQTYNVLGHREVVATKTTLDGSKSKRTCPGSMINLMKVRHKLEWAIIEAQKL